MKIQKCILFGLSFLSAMSFAQNVSSVASTQIIIDDTVCDNTRTVITINGVNLANQSMSTTSTETIRNGQQGVIVTGGETNSVVINERVSNQITLGQRIAQMSFSEISNNLSFRYEGKDDVVLIAGEKNKVLVAGQAGIKDISNSNTGKNEDLIASLKHTDHCRISRVPLTQNKSYDWPMADTILKKGDGFKITQYKTYQDKNLRKGQEKFRDLEFYSEIQLTALNQDKNSENANMKNVLYAYCSRNVKSPLSLVESILILENGLKLDLKQ